MPDATARIALSSTAVVTSDGVGPGSILIEGESIVGIVPLGEIPSDYTRDDVGRLVVMPGLIDTHVHINEPGRSDWEGFETATRAAAAGGFTTLVDMPLNSSPVTTTMDAFRSKLAAADGKLFVDCGYYGGLIPGNAHEMKSLADAGVLGIKAFLIHSGIDEFPNATETDLRTAMPLIAEQGIPLLVHCELDRQSISLSPPNDPSRARSYSAYLASRPRDWEHDAINLMIHLCREYRCRVHIVHLSSADAVPALRRARGDGLPISVETCPHYLYFSADEIPDGDTRFKCAPPIRERENQARLWKALEEGVLDMIVSDHSPSLPALKCLETGDFSRAWGGIASLQLGLSIVWTAGLKRGVTLVDITKWMCSGPARLVGINFRKGSIAPGHDADFVIWDPEASFTVKGADLLHRHHLTPYEGHSLMGVIERTILRGVTIFERGARVSGPHGISISRRHNQT